MRSRDTYASAVHVFLFFFFLVGGVGFFAASFFPTYRYHCFRLFLDYPSYSFGGGALFFGFGALVLSLFSYKKELRFLMSPHTVDIDCKVIHTYVEQFWKEEFPHAVQAFDLYILPDNTLEIAVQLGSMDAEEKKQFLEKSEYGLGKILASFLDYHQKFYITMHLS
ncbi:MAG: hypothetical protein AAGI90_02585 [Chlamydiota bacterium]